MSGVVAGLAAVGALVTWGLGVRPRRVAARDARRCDPADEALERAPDDLERTTVRTPDGAELVVVSRGAGRPLVLVHGLSLSSDLWRYQFHDLADSFRVVAVDLRGHGSSTVGTRDVGPHVFADDLAAVLEALDLRDALVVGHSLGGTVVGQFCADHPDVVRERVGGLVFVGTFASAIAGEGWFRERCSPTLVRAVARARGRAKPRAEPPSGALAYAMARTPFGPTPRADHVRFTQALGHRTPPAFAAAATVANLAYDVRAQLRRIEVPALVVRGAHDSLATQRSADQLAVALPNAEAVVVPGVGHLPMLEDRTGFAALLRRFAESPGVR